MSCDWNIRCVTCGETHGFDDANHADDLMRFLISHADAIADLAPMFTAADAPPKPNYRYTIELTTSYGRIAPAWFAQHRGHELRPISEYGRLDTQCDDEVTCDAGHRHACQLDRGHEGAHSGRRS